MYSGAVSISDSSFYSSMLLFSMPHLAIIPLNLWFFRRIQDKLGPSFLLIQDRADHKYSCMNTVDRAVTMDKAVAGKPPTEMIP